jgi:hypothetical protein
MLIGNSMKWTIISRSSFWEKGGSKILPDLKKLMIQCCFGRFKLKQTFLVLYNDRSLKFVSSATLVFSSKLDSPLEVAWGKQNQGKLYSKEMMVKMDSKRCSSGEGNKNLLWFVMVCSEYHLLQKCTMREWEDFRVAAALGFLKMNSKMVYMHLFNLTNPSAKLVLCKMNQMPKMLSVSKWKWWVCLTARLGWAQAASRPYFCCL